MQDGCMHLCSAIKLTHPILPVLRLLPKWHAYDIRVGCKAMKCAYGCESPTQSGRRASGTDGQFVTGALKRIRYSCCIR